jgi:hypothetical protein
MHANMRAGALLVSRLPLTEKGARTLAHSKTWRTFSRP